MRTCGKIGRMNKKGFDAILKNNHVVLGVMVALCMTGLLACGESSGDSKGAAPEGDEVVVPVATTYTTEDDLPGCIEKFEGDVALVEKDSVAFKCEDGRWVNKGKYIANEEDVKNCTEKREGEVAYIVNEGRRLVCEDGKWVKAADKVGESVEPTEGASSSSSVTQGHGKSSGINSVEGASLSNEESASNSSSSHNDEQGASSSESNGSKPTEVPSSSNASSSSSWNEVSRSCSSNGEISSNSSSSRNDNKEESSSSVASSSSEKLSSSSVASSSSVSSLSSVASSSSVESSSSSVLSSSAVELNCSVLLEGENGWNWDVPKECRFNSAISYGTMIDDRDNKVYKTIKIDSQTWMAENLNYSDSATTQSLLKRSWCYYNVAANCAVTGRLYTWAAAIDSVKLYDGGNGVDCGYGKICSLPEKVQGICPDGWHLPDTTEWKILFKAVGGKYNSAGHAGRVLKSQTGWFGGGNGIDSVGFSALPTGLRYNYDDFYSYGCNAYFWSTSQINDNYAYGMYLYYKFDDAELLDGYKDHRFSVRCVKD